MSFIYLKFKASTPSILDLHSYTEHLSKCEKIGLALDFCITVMSMHITQNADTNSCDFIYNHML